MKHKNLTIACLAISLPLAAGAATIDFEAGSGYSLGDLAGQPSSGTQWAMTNGGGNIVNVASGIGTAGSNGITGTATGGGSNFVYYGYNTSNADLGFTFDSTSSVINYSFDWQPTQAMDGGTGDEIFRLTIGSSSNIGGSAAANLTIRASGRLIGLDGGTNRAVDGLFTLNTYSNISGTIDYGSNTYTVFVDNTQQFTSVNGGNLAFNNIASDNAFIRIGNLNGASTTGQYRTWTADNISVIPEPGAFALLGGLFVLGTVALRRRR